MSTTDPTAGTGPVSTADVTMSVTAGPGDTSSSNPTGIGDPATTTSTSMSSTASDTSGQDGDGESTSGFHWPMYPPVQCGAMSCASNELCIFDPGSDVCGDTGSEGFYRCELYPDYCAEMSDPFGCLEFYFCGGCSDFSQGFLTCKCSDEIGVCDSDTD